jgi:alpha-L-fucosidase 2
VNLSIQPLKNGMEHATAWKEISGDWGRRLYLSVGWGKTGEAAKEAAKVVNDAAEKPIQDLMRTHLKYWHNYWPESFVSIPDARMESFYWIQMYKLASATREGRPAIDLLGPWFNTTPWAKIWWNLNIQLTYWTVLASNRLELGKPLCKMIDDGTAALAKNAGQFSDDSSTIGRSASYDCVRAGGDELCDFPWVMHNYYLQYRYSMDDEMLRERLFPMLKRSINYYFHFMKTGSDGKLHITRGFSPEYPGQPKPNPDCNIDLALVRWGCQTLLDISERLKIDDPLVPKWKETLANLTPYPTDSNGLKISASVPFAQSHRHYSHLLMIYPLYIMNPEQPENRELVIKSLTHWMGMPQALRGYSYTGASSISALMGNGDDAAMYLNKLLDSKMIPPNTLYAEAGPCIETPLSGAACVHDMLLSSWGNKVRVFPAVPSTWKDVAIKNMRTEGAFLVTATRKAGKTQFVRIESLAGEPCRLVTDLENPVVAPAADELATAPQIKIKHIGPREYELDLKKGQTALLVPSARGSDLTIAPVETKGSSNFYGLH